MRDLSSMQAAYWFARDNKQIYGAVSAHLYAEFDGARLDAKRLQAALISLCRLQPMVQLIVNKDGRQKFSPTSNFMKLESDDLANDSPKDIEDFLFAKRRLWTNKIADIANGRPVSFSLTHLPHAYTRLHVDADMIAVDPPSFVIMMEYLSRLYRNPDWQANAPALNYFEWYDSFKADNINAKKSESDRHWWKGRLGDIAPAPKLPVIANRATAVDSDRLCAKLSIKETTDLRALARSKGVTFSVLTLSIFAAILGNETGDKTFRLNVPMFFRQPAAIDPQEIVGEFSNILIVSVDLRKADTLYELCRNIAAEMTDVLSHSAYPGVNVMRDLSRYYGTMQIAPVVFTAGLDLEKSQLFSDELEDIFGEMAWVISQGPMVALDAQIALVKTGILINWDIRRDALPKQWIDRLFERFVSSLHRLADDPTLMTASLIDFLSVHHNGPQLGYQTNVKTQKMLLAIVTRLYPSDQITSTTKLEQNTIETILGFISRYLPDREIEIVPTNTGKTVKELSDIIVLKSGGLSENIASAYLYAINGEAL